MIDGLKVSPLMEFKDNKGSVKKMISKDHPDFTQFGEIYFSITNPGIIKGWKYHHEIIQLMTVVSGQVKLIVYDDRKDSPTYKNIQEIIFGEDEYQLITMPPKIWYSFKCLSQTPAIIANCINQPHDPNESITADLDSDLIPYRWERV